MRERWERGLNHYTSGANGMTESGGRTKGDETIARGKPGEKDKRAKNWRRKPG